MRVRRAGSASPGPPPGSPTSCGARGYRVHERERREHTSMTWWEAVTLGLVQGLTELLPVSSSGHLVIGQALLGLRLPGIAFEVVVHAATLVSVAVAYRTRLASLAVGAFAKREPEDIRYIALLVLATVP